MNYVFGCYNKDVQMAQPPEILEEILREVRLHKSRFKVQAGPMLMKAGPLKSVYALEILYRESENDHPLGGQFNSHICDDFAKEAHIIADEFCARQGFRMTQPSTRGQIIRQS